MLFALLMPVSGHAAELLHDEAAPGERLLGVPLRIGAFGGWHATGDLDVLGDRVEGNEPEAGAAFGLRLGVRATRTWGLDLTLGAIPAGSEWLLPFVVEGRWRPLDDGWTPTFGFGAGIYAGLGKGGDADALFDAAVGVEVMLGSGVALRVEGAVWMSDGIEGTFAFSPVITLGIDLLAYREKRVAIVEPHPSSAVKGCPAGVAPERCGNADQDEFIDAFDRCPLVSGTIDGCPDDDGDGLPVPRDACPTKRGARIDWGCPR